MVLSPGERKALELAAKRHTDGDMSELLIRQALYSFVIANGPEEARAIVLREMIARKQQGAEQ